MSKRYNFKNNNYTKRYNKFDQEWKEGNNYRPINNNYHNSNNSYYNKQKNNNYNNYQVNDHNNYLDNGYNRNNNYQDNSYNNYNSYYQNNGYNNYNSYYQNNGYNNYHRNNHYNNKYKRGNYPYFRNRKYYIEVELDAQNEINEKFSEELKKLGFYIKEVKGDGNCLFRSVSEQLEGNENNYEIYRQKCVDYMKENKDAFIPFLEEEEPIDTYIEKISKDGEWGGNLEIYALSMALNANFYIYIHEQPIYIVKTVDETTNNIMMTYHNGKHYNSLRKLEKEKTEMGKKEDNDRKNEENRNEEKKEENNEENKEKDKNEKKIDDVHDLISKVNHLNI